MCADKTITLYHSSPSCGTPRCNKDILDDSQQILYTRPYALFAYLHKGLSHMSTIQKGKKKPTRQLQARINLNHRTLSMLSMDLKVMLRSHKGHKFILCIIDEVTNYLVTVPIYHSRSKATGDAVIENIISKFCIPEDIIMD